MKKAMVILWPAFLAAGAAEVVFFTIVDPLDFELGRMSAYSIAFFLFWTLAAGSSALTCFLQRGADEVNRCPLTPPNRPVGCPKREPGR
jgi:hypothetical protein